MPSIRMVESERMELCIAKTNKSEKETCFAFSCTADVEYEQGFSVDFLSDSEVYVHRRSLRSFKSTGL